jgi:hypothetical protein
MKKLVRTVYKSTQQQCSERCRRAPGTNALHVERFWEETGYSCRTRGEWWESAGCVERTERVQLPSPFVSFVWVNSCRKD